MIPYQQLLRTDKNCIGNNYIRTASGVLANPYFSMTCKYRVYVSQPFFINARHCSQREKVGVFSFEKGRFFL